jgi:hypothetical protein
VARGWGTPAIVGAEAVKIDGKSFHVGDVVVKEGDVISIDGTTGEVVLGAMELAAAEPPAEFHTILKWADVVRKGKLGVRANADTGDDATNARQLGAEGIGLCRTEHMFLAPDRLPVVREMILADTPAEEAAALAELRPCAADRLRGDPRWRWTACPSRCACSTRRCTSSCRRPRSCDQEGHEGPHQDRDRRAEGCRGVGRAQPDDRYPRRAPRRRQAGPLRDAGAGAHGRGRCAAQEGQEPDRRSDDPAHRHPRGARSSPAAGCRRRSIVP